MADFSLGSFLNDMWEGGKDIIKSFLPADTSDAVVTSIATTILGATVGAIASAATGGDVLKGTLIGGGLGLGAGVLTTVGRKDATGINAGAPSSAEQMYAADNVRVGGPGGLFQTPNTAGGEINPNTALMVQTMNDNAKAAQEATNAASNKGMIMAGLGLGFGALDTSKKDAIKAQRETTQMQIDAQSANTQKQIDAQRGTPVAIQAQKVRLLPQSDINQLSAAQHEQAPGALPNAGALPQVGSFLNADNYYRTNVSTK